MDPLDQPATAAHLRRLAVNGVLTPAQLELALARAGHLPTPQAWVRFAGRSLLLFGAALLIVGIFFFFGYNWDGLHRFVKLGLVQALILACGGYGIWRGLERLDGQVALFAACVLFGALLLVFGQVYPTGAPAYRFTLAWALLILLPTLAARNAPLWMLFAALLMQTLYSFWELRIAGAWAWRDAAVFALSAAILTVWELARSRGALWMRSPWYGRALLAWAVVTGWVLLDDAITSGWYLNSGSFGLLIGPLLALGLGALATWYYRWPAPDLLALSLLALGAICVVTIQLAQWLTPNWDNAFSALLLGVLVLAQVAVVTLLLLRARGRMEVTP